MVCKTKIQSCVRKGKECEQEEVKRKAMLMTILVDQTATQTLWDL